MLRVASTITILEKRIDQKHSLVFVRCKVIIKLREWMQLALMLIIQPNSFTL